MRKHLTTVAIVIVLAAAPSAHAGIKCWTNKDGVRECGNSVPPEYAQQETETKDKRGLTIDKSERAKTLDELEAERQQAKIDHRLAEEARKRAARNRVLLDTFSSEDDLVLTRDGQIAHLESQIRLTDRHIEKLEKNLDQMIDRAAEVERRGENASDEMVANIANVRGQIVENEDFIASKRREQEDIRVRFDTDIERFRELKAAAASLQPSPMLVARPLKDAFLEARCGYDSRASIVPTMLLPFRAIAG